MTGVGQTQLPHTAIHTHTYTHTNSSKRYVTARKRIYILYNTSGISNLSDPFRKDIVNLSIYNLVSILNVS